MMKEKDRKYQQVKATGSGTVQR